MSDRIDKSQYPEAYDYRELAAPNFRDGVEGEYPANDPQYATVDELTNYPDHHDRIPDPAVMAPPIVVSAAPPSRELRYRAIGGGGAAVYGRNRFAGYSVRELTGTAPAVIRFRDGLDVSGNVVVTLQVPAGASASVFLNPATSIPFGIGVFVEIVSGTVEGSFFMIGDYRD